MSQIKEGTILGKYRVIRPLGTGGMATVYLAEQINLGGKVALKVLLPHLATNPEMVQRFMREARSANRLRHPNIIHIEDVYHVDDLYFFVMDYVEGETLREFLARRGRLPEKDVLHISRQIAMALVASHNHPDKVIHRDIKPGNILVHRTGQITVTDFGIAKVAEDSLVTKAGSVLGTIKYSSPEQTAGKEVGPATDIYSLGVVMYEMAVGEPPFNETDTSALLNKVINQIPAPPRLRLTSVSNSLSDMIMKALEKDPQDRFESAQDMLDTINGLLRGDTFTYTPSRTSAVVSEGGTIVYDPSSGGTGGVPQGKPVFLWGAVVVLLAAVAIGAWFFLTRGTTVAPSDQQVANLNLGQTTENASRRAELAQEAERLQKERERMEAEKARLAAALEAAEAKVRRNEGGKPQVDPLTREKARAITARAESLIAKNEFTEAKDLLKQAVNIDPEFIDARTLLARLPDLVKMHQIQLEQQALAQKAEELAEKERAQVAADKAREKERAGKIERERLKARDNAKHLADQALRAAESGKEALAANLIGMAENMAPGYDYVAQKKAAIEQALQANP